MNMEQEYAEISAKTVSLRQAGAVSRPALNTLGTHIGVGVHSLLGFLHLLQLFGWIIRWWKKVPADF